MTRPTPIDCNLHDHIEVACLYRYDLEIRLRDGACVAGRAGTTRTGSDKTEYLVLDSGGKQFDVPMHEIAVIDVMTRGARFASLQFP